MKIPVLAFVEYKLPYVWREGVSWVPHEPLIYPYHSLLFAHARNSASDSFHNPTDIPALAAVYSSLANRAPQGTGYFKVHLGDVNLHSTIQRSWAAEQETSVEVGSFFDPEDRGVCSSETSFDFQWITRRYIPEDTSLHTHRCDNLKSYILFRKLSWRNEERHNKSSSRRCAAKYSNRVLPECHYPPPIVPTDPY
jgi:hypothetical protein